MYIASPKSDQEFQLRDRLIQACLRPEPLNYDVSSEYPIVLNRNSPSHSYCIFNHDEIVAHANLWPRTIVNKDLQLIAKVGLIGNVATAPSHQGTGLMTRLFQHLESEAIRQDLEALVLWSDLEKFYQKLGFQKSVSEWHFHIGKRPYFEFRGRHKILPASEMTRKDLALCQSLREKTPASIARSLEEFSQLCAIPDTHFILSLDEKSKITGYGIFGKGYDMNGVLHEWGYPSANTLVEACQYICHQNGYPELIILAPASIAKNRIKLLKLNSIRVRQQAMCYIRPLSKNPELTKALGQFFIWGLDSI